MSKLTSSFASISNGLKSKQVIPLVFSEWGKGCIFEWYNEDLTGSGDKLIQKLEIWKDITGPVPHRFIVLHTSNNRIHRFDRRPDRDPNSGATTARVLANRAVTSQDTCMPDIALSSVEQGSVLEIELVLNGQVDLLAVVSACYAISKDNSARNYTFLRHNCFFFSWTILMVVSRHYLPYEVPQRDSIIQQFQSQLDRLTSFIVGEVITLFLNLFIEIMTAFRKKADQKPAVYQGLHIISKALWRLPDGVLRFSLRQLFIARLHFGLRAQLKEKTKAKLQVLAKHTYQALLSKHVTPDSLNEHLWIKGTEDTVRNGYRKEFKEMFWEFILEVISSGFGDIEAEQVAAQLQDSPKSSLFGPKIAQFCAVWNAGLHGGLQAARTTKAEVGGLSDQGAFDQIWFAVRHGALSAAKKVVERTREQINDPRRDRMWDSIWVIWEESWEEARETARTQSLEVVEKIIKEGADTTVRILIEDMRKSKAKTVQARMPKKERKWLHTHRQAIAEMTNATLQEYMQDIIQKDTVNKEALGDVNSSMALIWTEARKHLPALAALPAETPTGRARAVDGGSGGRSERMTPTGERNSNEADQASDANSERDGRR